MANRNSLLNRFNTIHGDEILTVTITLFLEENCQIGDWTVSDAVIVQS